MPRSSRHKSSKHSSRDARDYSDSEDELSLKERKANEEANARVPKDSGPSEKRKLDSKDGKELYGSGNGEYLDECSSSKRRKDKAVDGVSDRWNGGGEADERGGDSSKKAKGASESKSRRRDDEIEEMKRSGGKSEKHRETSRKEGRESERRGREAKGEKSGDNEEGRSSKREITTESKSEAAVQNPDSLSENLLEGRSKRKRDGSADWSKHQDDIGDGKNRHASSVEDAVKDARRKDEKQRDDKYRDRCREEVDRDSKNRVEKKKDEFPAKDRAGIKSNDKYSKDDRDNTEARQKKSKPHDGLREHDIDSAHDHDHDRDRDRGRGRDRDRDREHDQDGKANRDRIRSGERDRNLARDKERDRDWEHDHDRDRDRDRDRDHDRDREWEVEIAHHDDRSIKYKDRRGRKRSPDDHDDYSESKLRGSKAHNSDSEKRTLSGSKVEADGRVGSQSRQAHTEITVNSSRRRASPTSSSHGGTDEHRHVRQDDLKYRDLPMESRLKLTERVSKYRSLEKPSKMDDGHYVELSGERSSSSKQSPRGLVDRSPSSPGLERRHMHRTGVRRSLDVEEQGRSGRASADARDVSVGDGRFTRDIPSEKPVLDESPQADSSFYNRPGQRSSSIPAPPFRSGLESPTFMGLEEDGRNNLNARYKRSGDLNLGRGPVNNWRSVPNWSSPVPNGFMPFQHGPPHGNFQGLMPHFPSPPLFGVRPPMDINQSGIPYPMADTDRFPGHMRPLGWPNMIDASGPPRLHGWDVNTGALRNEPPIYAGPDWDHSRHPVNSRGWETSSDMWKGHSGGANVDLPSTSHKESIPVLFPVNEGSAGQGTQKPNNEDSHEVVQAKAAEIKASVASSEKETSTSNTEMAGENKPSSSKLSESNKRMNISRFYLSKLDISAELVHSEVYQCCMNSLDGELNSTTDEDPIMRVILKKRPRLEPKASDGPLSSSLFPAIDDSVFQKAMDLYKKERLETRDIAVSKGGLLDFVLPTTLNKVKEQDRVCHEVEKEEPARTVDERIQSPTSAADQMEVKAILSAVAEEKTGDLVAISRKDLPETILVSYSKKSGLVQKDQGYLGEDPIGLSPGEKGDLMHMSVNVDDARADHILSRDHASQAAAVLPIDDSGGELVVKTASDHISEGSGDFGNKVGDSLVVDGPSSTHEASMPGSNESQLLNLSRIHHSPESTH